jgi:type II secretory pathway pseudopilin PulG
MKREQGFTLVEIIVALGVGMVIIAAIYSVINLTQRTSSGLERRVVAQQDARGTLELMAAEIRMASYNPLSLRSIWFDAAANCTSTATDHQDYRGIREATANSISIEMDINDDGDIGDTNEIIVYNYNATNKYITRSTCGGAQALLGALNANQDTKTVLVENSTAGPGNTAIPLFRYFDGSGTEIFPTAADKSPIPNIRRVLITIVADTQYADAGSSPRRRIIYSTSVIPRNHFTLIYN